VKVLVIAQQAQISNALVSWFEARGRSYQCVTHDWLTGSEQPVVIPDDIGAVINTLPLETETEDSLVLQLTADLASSCQKSGAVLIQLSSSSIFPPQKGGRHKESEDINPDTEIETRFLKVEQAVYQSLEQHIILRTGPVFSHEDSNVLTSMVDQLKQAQVLNLSQEGSSCPVHAADLARVISGMIDQIACGGHVWGTYHYHSSDPVSYFKFAEAVQAALVKYDNTVEIVDLKPIDQLDEQWITPLLSCEKILNTFGIKQLPWRSYIATAVKHLVMPGQKNDNADLVS